MDLAVSEMHLGDKRLFTGIVRDVTERHTQLETERALLATKEEFRVARSIQQTFFPASAPSVPGLDIGGASYPATATSGDYFDYLAMPDGRIGVVVADVSGHGLGPALLMSQARAYLHALLPVCADPSDLLTRLNDFLNKDCPEDKFVTMFLAEFVAQSLAFRYASAGHQCYLFGSTGDVESLESTGLPLGIMPGTIPSAAPRTLVPGQVVLLVTDGVEEAHSPDGTCFGIQRVLDNVRANRDRRAGEMVERLYREVRSFAQESPQEDDITVVVIKVVGR
jgi:serine phosphatase RsbU (regulator of sigma subunit)